jgi:hypothetical protein
VATAAAEVATAAAEVARAAADVATETAAAATSAASAETAEEEIGHPSMAIVILTGTTTAAWAGRDAVMAGATAATGSTIKTARWRILVVSFV